MSLFVRLAINLEKTSLLALELWLNDCPTYYKFDLQLHAKALFLSTLQQQHTCLHGPALPCLACIWGWKQVIRSCLTIFHPRLQCASPCSVCCLSDARLNSKSQGMRNAFQIPVSLYGLALPGNAWFKNQLFISMLTSSTPSWCIQHEGGPNNPCT